MPVIINGSTGISGTDGSAATPAVQGTDTNTGIYFPGNDRIAFAEGGVQVGEFDASGNFQFNSGYGSVATAFGCRAWVNFNGTGTVAIRASGNVSSITDNGTGDYTVNFTNAMPDANYCGNATNDRWPDGISTLNTFQTTSVRNINSNGAGGLEDRQTVCVAIFR
ncbi:hypothetical protein UFOVP397_6 [uncultured Caudovirales phage]|uniref:Uncharacterized protein n=1 Tax=uncultured Caudovirales phage TaxID=2100421 RepID=A0A6J5M4K4_9CAUD|nr:hypothetical protein UFOVP397_6 [uncultured Caudovirales phage]